MKIKRDNRGITLIELIVVVAIMMVLTAVFALSVSLISRQRVSNAASSTKSMLQLAQTYSKSKDQCIVKISGRGDGGAESSIYTYDRKGKEKLGNGPSEINKRITTIVKYDDEEKTEVTITPGTVVEIEFERSTGAFASVQIPGKSAGITAHPIQIIFTNGDKSTVLDLATNTGVITYE